MFYIYEITSTNIMGKLNKNTGLILPDYRQCYKTMPAAKAALTRMSKHHSAMKWPSVNDPQYRFGISEAGHFHKSIEKSRTVYSIMDEAKENPIIESVNTPGYMSPSREAFWSM